MAGIVNLNQNSCISVIPCPKCRSLLPWEIVAAEDYGLCPGCKSKLDITMFSALFKDIEKGKQGETLLEDGLASCFYHPGKKASVTCESCGRFLCALCDIEIADKHLCSVCLEKGKQKDKIEQIRTRRVLYDDVALTVALLPLLMWPITLITAPVAIFIAIKHWNSPSSIIPRTKLRNILAIIFALLQIAGWIFFGAYLWRDWI